MTTRVGWQSKDGRSADTAHFVLDDGTTACSHVRYMDGPMLAPFRCNWVALREHDHLCGHCRRLHPRVCRCGSCSLR
jgi:hypothetical protein